ncbi:LysR substrate-binding domain-containing protein [Xylophilus sp.]|uniref:LysR substrate-binding domain-containing protein n=1 Tax=Xylophilus sp. TaxID=2653893 RepID=UPI0013BAA2F8|nr:LysR substrate-binding domain-containing protein [Xylophilus sp.]KAF1046861.1 MAG: HTH-type transcriptional regulator CynR [Xylophilus sp.]
MDLGRLAYFAGVAEAGSFSRGAATLHLSQPALSRQVQLLEEELGQRLLVRTGRGVEPTEAGVALLAHARAIFDLAEKARVDLAERQASPRGQVTVGLPPRVAYALAADLVERFRVAYPDAVISVQEGLSMRLREWLVAGRLDMALLFDPPYAAALQYETLAREPVVVVSAEPLPARMRVADLSNLALVLPSGPNALRRLIEEQARPRGVALRVVAEVDSVRTVLSLVERGVGATVLPRSGLTLWSGARAPQVAALYGPAVRNRVVLATPLARPITRTVRHATQLLRELATAYHAPAAPKSSN